MGKTRRNIATKGGGRAIPLIQLVDEEAGRYEVCEEARDLFADEPGPFGVIGIAGKYRTGKSFFMNRCLLRISSSGGGSAGRHGAQSNSFPVGNTVQACTKGLWLHSIPIETPESAAHGGPTRVFVLDTEGIGALDATDTNDSRIFAMALLLSSYFVYNSLNAIDEEAVNQLSLVANVCKQIQLDSGVEATPEQLGREVFPPLYWLVRDFALQLRNESGQEISPDEYLEFALKDRSATTTSAAGGTGSSEGSTDYDEKNRVRRCLRECFPKRGCATLVRPCGDEAKLQWLQSCDDSELKPMFRRQIEWVRNCILMGTPPKRTHGNNGAPMTGNAYLVYADAIVKAINNGSAPAIRSTWSLLEELHCRDAVEGAVSAYRSHMDEAPTPPSNEKELLDLWKEGKHVALEYYRLKCTAVAIKGNGSRSRHDAPFQAKVTEALEADKSRRLRELHRLDVANFRSKISETDAILGGGGGSCPDEDVLRTVLASSSEKIEQCERELRNALVPVLRNDDAECVAKILKLYHAKSWEWLRRLVKCLSNEGNAVAAVTQRALEEERHLWTSKLDDARAEHKEALVVAEKRHAELQEKLVKSSEDAFSSLADKETELAELQVKYECNAQKIMELEENVARCEEELASAQQKCMEEGGVSRECSKFAIDDLEDKLRAADAVRRELQEKLEECQSKYLGELRVMQEESRIKLNEAFNAQSMAETAMYERDDMLQQQKEDYEARLLELGKELAVRGESVKQLEEKCSCIELSFLKATEAQRAQSEHESALLSTQLAKLQELRVTQQIEWCNKVREAETSKCRAEAQVTDLKRRLDSVGDLTRIKRLKTTISDLTLKNAQLVNDKDWLMESNRTTKGDLERSRDETAKLRQELRELQCEKERALLRATLGTMSSSSTTHR